MRQIFEKFNGLMGLLVVAAFLALTAVACDTRGGNTVAERMTNASLAISEGDYDGAQMLCDELASDVARGDTAIGENEAGELAIILMKLSEHQNEDDNVATATQCLRYALRLSADSLRAFGEGLSLEDQRHFVLLRRIGLSIDNPVNLLDDDLTHDDGYLTDSVEGGSH